MMTLQESWREYRDKVYPADMPASQEAALHEVWFAASLDFLHKLVVEIAALPDDEAEKELSKLQTEALDVYRERCHTVKSRN